MNRFRAVVSQQSSVLSVVGPVTFSNFDFPNVFRAPQQTRNVWHGYNLTMRHKHIIGRNGQVLQTKRGSLCKANGKSRARLWQRTPQAAPLSQLAATDRKPTFYLHTESRCHSDKPPSPARPSPDILSGEDAFIQFETPRFHVLGVADGVGGWSKMGVDPSLFAWELMKLSQIIGQQNESIVEAGPMALLDATFAQMQQERKVTGGSSTAAFAVIDKRTGVLRSVNLGDSAIAVVRNNEFILRSKDQQHYFNAPYQLTIVPDSMNWDADLDTPSMANTYTATTQPGDMIMLATDGYTDNVFSKSTLTICQAHTDALADTATSALHLSTLGDQLLEAAYSRSQSTTAVTPFCMHASEHGHYFPGGKPDDITLIVAVVQRHGDHSTGVNEHPQKQDTDEFKENTQQQQQQHHHHHHTDSHNSKNKNNFTHNKHSDNSNNNNDHNIVTNNMDENSNSNHHTTITITNNNNNNTENDNTNNNNATTINTFGSSPDRLWCHL